MMLLLEFKSHDMELVRWPDSIFLRRSTKTNCRIFRGYGWKRGQDSDSVEAYLPVKELPD